jgi:hypothetical protein
MKISHAYILAGITAAIAAPGASAQVFQDFEASTVGSTVLLQRPSFSGSTGSKIEAEPNFSQVVDTFPNGNSSTKAVNISWAIKSDAAAPWLRVTTANFNPTIDFNQNLSFDIWTDRALKLAIGVRETGTTAEIGANGGTTGSIEWVGVTGASGGAPLPIRTILPNQWTTVYFNIDGELAAGLTGNGTIDKGATGKGVLEHLALVPMTGESGLYNIYVDNFAVTAVPEPSTYAMIFGLAALGGGMFMRKKRA